MGSRSLPPIFFASFVLAAVGCGGSDDGVSFAPGPGNAQAGAGGAGGEGEAGAAGTEPGTGPDDPPPGGGAGAPPAGGAAGKAGKGGSGAAGKGGGSGTGGKGGGSGTGGKGGGSGASGKGGSDSGAVGPENTAERCADGFDNDGDGFFDCADNDCRALLASCREDTFSACTDGLDNDDDGHADCDDFDCQKESVGAGCPAAAACTDPYEPGDDAPAGATVIEASEGGGPACSENHSICASDIDRYLVRFEAFSSGGTLDLRLRVFSQASGSVIVTMRDPSGKVAPVTKSLSKMPETLKLLFDTAIVCDGSCGDVVVRELEVIYEGPAKPFYRVCGELL